MQIRIEVHDRPGRHRGEHRDVHVGVQRRGDNADILDPVRADVATASCQFEITPTGSDLRGARVRATHRTTRPEGRAGRIRLAAIKPPAIVWTAG
jgi:Family of unknown function (DUF5990)